MKNYLRTLRLATRYRLTLVGVLVSSLVIAVLWGGNVSAIYPLVEVSFKGHSLQQWADQRIDQEQQRSAELRVRIQQNTEQLATAPEDQQRPLQRTIDRDAYQLRASEKSLATTQRIRPYLDRWLPSSPFNTVVLIVGLAMLGTLIKDVFLFINNMLVERVSQLIAFDLRLDRRRTRSQGGEASRDGALQESRRDDQREGKLS